MFKKIFSVIFIIYFLIGINSGGYSQNDEFDLPEEKFNFSFDYCFFQAKDGYTLLELYYSVFRQHLKHVPVDGKKRAEFVFNAQIWKDDSLLASSDWRNSDTVDSLAQMNPGQHLYGVGFFALKPGEYRLELTLTDINSKYSKNLIRKITVESISEDKLEMSDIQLASVIEKTDVQNRFYKNGYMVIPNSERFYGTGLPMLMFYFEIYNLKKEDEPDSTKYAITYQILNGDGELVRNFPMKTRIKPGKSAVEVSGMNIISFRSGTYFLQVDVKDLFNGAMLTKKKKFFIYREGDLAQSDSTIQRNLKQKIVSAYQQLYENLSVEELEDEIGAISYIATSEEKKVMNNLDEAGKRSFLIDFWLKRDRTPNTPQNEYRDEYLSMVRTANQQFTGFQKGWKTDRGRVLLVYGVPDEIERNPYSAENKPFIIWKYFSIQGGIDFVFVDKRDFGRYELVHSTARGELNDPDWQRWIRPN